MDLIQAGTSVPDPREAGALTKRLSSPTPSDGVSPGTKSHVYKRGKEPIGPCWLLCTVVSCKRYCGAFLQFYLRRVRINPLLAFPSTTTTVPEQGHRLPVLVVLLTFCQQELRLGLLAIDRSFRVPNVST